MKNNNADNDRKEKEKALITFLKRTKDGEYAKIDEQCFAYGRVKEQRDLQCEEEYYYGIR
jgi:hypothetical protein